MKISPATNTTAKEERVDNYALGRLLDDVKSLGDAHVVLKIAPMQMSKSGKPIAGRFACGHNEASSPYNRFPYIYRNVHSYGNVPEMHVCGVGQVVMPMTQDVQEQLQRLCQQAGQPEQPAACGNRQAWPLNASLLAATSPGNTVHVRTASYMLPHSLTSGHTLAQVGMIRCTSLPNTSAKRLLWFIQQTWKLGCNRSHWFMSM